MRNYDFNFRILFKSSILLLFLSASVKDNPSEIETDNVLWYQQPAQSWLEALPLGNGKIGAMVYGIPEKEQLQLNEETLWAGAPEDPIPANAKKHYAKFQKLNLAGQFDKALDYAMKNLAISPTGIRSYQPLGDLFISFDNHHKVENYRRDLNLQTGINTTKYTINGKRFIRESFISVEYNTLFCHFKSIDNQTVTSKITFDREKDLIQYFDNNTLIVDGQIFDDSDGYDDNPGGSGKGGKHMKFAANIYVKNTSGKLQSEKNELIITNSEEFTVMVTAATDYNIDVMNFDRDIKPLAICEATIKKVATLDYESVKAEHIARHRIIMDRVKFDITPENSDTIPIDKRLVKLKKNKEDKHLTELLFQYGRYLLLSSSGGNSVLPANLQGIWNKDMWAAWEADFHLNINLQMNYWSADICNLSETVDPLSVFMKNLAEKGQVTASKFIDTDGWMASTITNPFGRTTPSGSSKALQVDNGYCFPLGGAWMSLTLWSHYEFVQDKVYLKNSAYPVISGAARFILDFLSENEKDELVTVPSYSPENKYIDPESGKKLRNSVASALDIQIIRDVFHACLESEKILNQETELTVRINNALPKLPQTKIGKNGTIQEWYEDYEEVEVGHRHVSHLYALYPSNQINKNTPKLFEAAKKTLDRRLSAGGGQTGWSRAWMINFYARLFNGDECYQHISNLLEKQVAPNLFDLIFPNSRVFQIDGNLGATAGIAEMLLQSHEKNILRVLPSLPTAWKDGYITGLKARGGLTLDIYWSNNKLDKVIIKSDFDKSFNLAYNDIETKIKMNKGETYTYESDKK